MIDNKIPYSSIRSLLSSASIISAQEYIVVIGNIMSSALLFRYSSSLFGIYVFIGIVRAVNNTFFEAITRPMMNVIVEAKIANSNHVGSLMQSVWLLCAFVSIPSMLFWYHSASLFALAGVNQSIVSGLAIFSLPYLLSIVPNSIYDTDMHFLLATRDKFGFVLFTLLSMTSYFLLTYCFVYGYAGQALSGVMGLGISNLTYVLLNLSLVKTYLLTSANCQPFQLVHVDFTTLRDAVKLNVKLSLGPLISAIIKAPTSALVAILLGRLGEATLILNGLVGYAYYLLAPISHSIMLASTIAISECLGVGNAILAYAYGYIGLALITLLSATFALIISSSCPYWLAFSGMDVATFSLSNQHLFLFCFSATLYMGIEMVVAASLASLSAYKDTFTPTLLNAAVMSGVGLPLAFYAIAFLNMGIFGYFGAMASAGLITALLLTHRWHHVSTNRIAEATPTSQTNRFRLLEEGFSHHEPQANQQDAANSILINSIQEKPECLLLAK